MKKLAISLIVLLGLVSLAWGGLPLKPGNPGVPGLKAEIAQLEQMVANQNATRAWCQA